MDKNTAMQVAARIWCDPDYDYIAMNPKVAERIAILLQNEANRYLGFASYPGAPTAMESDTGPEPNNGWIPVTPETLPPERQPVHVFGRRLIQTCSMTILAYYPGRENEKPNDAGWWVDLDDGQQIYVGAGVVTHWQPLPGWPKGV